MDTSCKTILLKNEGKAGDMVHLVKCTNIRKGQSLITQNPCENPGTVACSYNPRTVEVERERSMELMPSQLNAINEVQANERPCLHIQGKWHQRKNSQNCPLASTHTHTTCVHIPTYLGAT